MKTKSTSWKLPVLIGVLVIIALLINLLFFNKAETQRQAEAQRQREAATVAEAKKAADTLAQEKKAAEEERLQAAKAEEAKRAQNEAQAKARDEAARKNAIEQAAAEHAQFLARYLNPGFTRKAGGTTIAAAVESEQRTMNLVDANALVQRFANSDVQILNSFFKPEFVADNFIDNVFSGDTSVLGRLELTNSLDGVLFGRETITYSTNNALENTASAELQLGLMLLPLNSAKSGSAWTLSATGAGFNNSDARQQAEKLMVSRIASDPTLSFTNFSTNK